MFCPVGQIVIIHSDQMDKTCSSFISEINSRVIQGACKNECARTATDFFFPLLRSALWQWNLNPRLVPLFYPSFNTPVQRWLVFFFFKMCITEMLHFLFYTFIIYWLVLHSMAVYVTWSIHAMQIVLLSTFTHFCYRVWTLMV